jgi:tripartite-type tricarboxylate transporter receptor subunit TctC
VGALIVVLAGDDGRAQETYPTRLVRIVVPYPAGGGTDTLARLLADQLSRKWGQSAIVENVGGAAGNIGSAEVARAAPDGYTLLLASPGPIATNSFLYREMGYDPARWVPVALLATGPYVLVLRKSFEGSTVKDLVAYAKANPGKISMASFGAGTSSHLAGELFQNMTGVKLVHVPYRGEAFALADMISGHVEVMFDTLSAALPHIRSDALRPLAMAGKTRHEALPDVPTVSETVAGYEAMSWGGIGVRRGTPPEIIERLADEINAGLADPVVRKRLNDVAATPIFYTPAEFSAFMASETEKWAKVVKASGVKPD